MALDSDMRRLSDLEPGSVAPIKPAWNLALDAAIISSRLQRDTHRHAHRQASQNVTRLRDASRFELRNAPQLKERAARVSLLIP